MRKKIFVIMTIAALTIGTVTAVYAKENNKTNNLGYRGSMMNQNSGSRYNTMIDLMKENGFEDAAKAMENRDFDYMDDFMNNMTDDQYKKMIDIMKNNGYESMARMMGNVSREEMIDMHNSMMGR